MRCIYRLIHDAIQNDTLVAKPIKTETEETIDVRLGCGKNTVADGNQMCMICLENTEASKYIKLGICGHSFHKDCVDLYIFSQMNRRVRTCNKNKVVSSYPLRCPLCRRITRINVGKKTNECELLLKNYII